MSKPLTKALLERMRVLRARDGLSYYVLSLRFGVPESTIEKKLRGSAKGENVSPDCR